MNELDISRFERATEIAMLSGEGGIGTLGEKLVHRALKYYIEPDESCHEVAFCGCVADVKRGDMVYEIQTRAFERLLPKLERFTPSSRVVIVYPLIVQKTLSWLDTDSGELTPPRRVSRCARKSDALAELSKIKEYIGNERVEFRLVLLSARELRYLDGYGVDRKRRATKIDKIPTGLLGDISFRALSDYAALMPDDLPQIFTAKNFERATLLRGRRAYFALKFCIEMGFITKIGKEKNAYIYKRNTYR